MPLDVGKRRQRCPTALIVHGKKRDFSKTWLIYCCSTRHENETKYRRSSPAKEFASIFLQFNFEGKHTITSREINDPVDL